jgi:hypothetical protein
MVVENEQRSQDVISNKVDAAEAESARQDHLGNAWRMLLLVDVFDVVMLVHASLHLGDDVARDEIYASWCAVRPPGRADRTSSSLRYLSNIDRSFTFIVVVEKPGREHVKHVIGAHDPWQHVDNPHG